MTTLVPGELVIGLPQLTAWVAFTPVITGSGSDPALADTHTAHGYWRRVGDSMEIRFDYSAASATGATGGTGDYLLTVPGGETIDSAKVTIGTSGRFPSGYGMCFSDALTARQGGVAPYTSTKIALFLPEVAAFWGNGTGTMTQVHLNVGFWAIVPITGWTV